MSGVPAWARDASAPEPLRLLDVVLEVCRAFPAYTVEAVLDLPTRQFWRIIENIRQRNEHRAQAMKDNPLAALSLFGER